MKCNLFYFCLVFIIICWGCEKQLDTSKLDLNAGKATVNCYLTDSKNKIYLYLNKPHSIGETYVYSNYNIYSTINDAKVFIENTNEKRQLIYNDTIIGYQCDTTGLLIVKGNSFKLQVILHDGTELTSSLTIPSFNNVNYTYNFNIHNSVPYSHYDYRININNQSLGKKFILFELKVPGLLPSNDTIYFDLENVVAKVEANKNELTIAGSNSTHFYFYPGIPGYPIDIKSYTINEDLYKYLVTVNNNLAAGNDPDAEPSPLFSNINGDGGIGIFGAVMK